MMKKINSETEYNTLYLASKNMGKELSNNFQYYKQINDFYNNKGKNNQFQSESLSKLSLTYEQNSSSPNKFQSESLSKLSLTYEQNSSSPNKEKNHIKTQTDLDNRTNYYESLKNEINHKKNELLKNNLNVKSAVEYNNSLLENFSIKKKLENINMGIAYKIHNGFKYYFNLPNEQIYILKEATLAAKA